MWYYITNLAFSLHEGFLKFVSMLDSWVPLLLASLWSQSFVTRYLTAETDVQLKSFGTIKVALYYTLYS